MYQTFRSSSSCGGPQPLPWSMGVSMGVLMGVLWSCSVGITTALPVQSDFRFNVTCPSACHCDHLLTTLRCDARAPALRSLLDLFQSLPINHVRSVQLHDLSLANSSAQPEALDAHSFALPASIHHLHITHCVQPPVCAWWLNSTRWSDQLITLELPANHLQFVPWLRIANLKQLDLSSNRFRFLASNQFRWCSGIRQLNLSHNQIAAVRSAPFADLNKLQYLNLAHNQIKSIALLALHALPSLIELDLSHNPLLDHDLSASLNSSSLLSSSSSLPSSSSSSSSSSSPSSKSIEPLLRLHSIALNHVTLSRFPDWLLSPQLLRLTFTGNRMQLVNRVHLQRHPLLIELDLSQNQIANISDDAFVDNDHLLHLDLSNNRLQSIDHVIWPRSIQYLRMSANHIRTLSFNTFDTLAHLQALDLSNNQLHSVRYEHINVHSLCSLNTLDLSDNVPLRNVSLPVTKSMRHLKMNQLPNLQINIIDQLAPYTSLEALQVSASPWLARDLLQHLDRWNSAHHLKYFNLGSNQITTLDQHVLQRQLSPSTLIDLHDNPFDCDISLQWLAQEVHMQQQQPSLPRQLPQMLQMHEMRCDRPQRLHNHSIIDMILIPSASSSASAASSASSSAAYLDATGLRSGESAQKLTGFNDIRTADLNTHRDPNKSPGYYPLIAYLVVFNAVLVLAALVPCSLLLFLGLAVCGEQPSLFNRPASSSLNRLRRLVGHEMLTSERVSFSSRNDQVAIISSEHFDQSADTACCPDNNPSYH